jgi:hypothetical protein
MMSWLHRNAGLVRLFALMIFLGLMAAGVVTGEPRLFRIEAATL